jgi:hypothetical protein
LILAGWSGAVAVAEGAETPQAFQEMIFPVMLGMSRDAVFSTREKIMKDRPVDAITTNGVVFMEVESQSEPVVGYTYHFVGDRLCAVRKAISYRGSKDKQAIQCIHDTLKKNFVKLADEQVLQMGVNGQAISEPAELWQDKANGYCIYFADTARTVLVIIFDPRFCNKSDFFLDAETYRTKLAPALQNARNQLESVKQRQAEQEAKQKNATP